jgi:hypothetical protein
MWNWLNCYLSGRHDFGVSCAPGAIFLRCTHCGKQSSGWALKDHQAPLQPARAQVARPRVMAPAVVTRSATPLPFTPRGIGRLHSA